MNESETKDRNEEISHTWTVSLVVLRLLGPLVLGHECDKYSKTGTYHKDQEYQLQSL